MNFPLVSKLGSLVARWRVGESSGPVRALQALPAARGASLLGCALTLFFAIFPVGSVRGASELEKLGPPGSAPGARYGGALLLSQGHLFVGAPGASPAQGQVYVYRGAPSKVRLSQVLRPVVGAGESFGSALTKSGNTLFVGAPAEKRVYLFELDSSGYWRLGQVIRGEGAAFGQSLAVSGTTLAVGAPQQEMVEASTRLDQAGAVHIYEKEGSRWEKRELLRAPERAAQDQFGTAVALREDWLLVGAQGVDRLPARGQPFAFDAGAVFSFRRDSAGRWDQLPVFRINAPLSHNRAGFGQDILLRQGRVIIAAPQDSAGSLLAGSVYIYRPSSFRTGQLILEQRLDAPPGAGPNDKIGTSFGSSIALSSNHEYLAVGSVGVPVDFANPDAGELRLFRADPDSSRPYRPESQVMRASDAEALDFGGSSVAVSDGGELWMGAFGDDDQGMDAGAIYRFRVADASLPAPVLAFGSLLCLAGGLTLARRRVVPYF